LNFLKAAVESGEYASTSEAVREALREWQWKHELRGEDLNRLRALWAEGEARGGRKPIDPESTVQEARERFRKVSESAR
jgi:antitoxin ParD1/3/4